RDGHVTGVQTCALPIFGLAGMAAVSGIFGGSPTGADLIAGAIGGIGGGAVVAMLYRGLALGTMALVAPVTGVVAAFIPVVYGATSEERRVGKAGCARVP